MWQLSSDQVRIICFKALVQHLLKLVLQTTTHFMSQLNFRTTTWEACIVYNLWVFFPTLITCFKYQFVIELTCLTPYCILGGCLVVTTKENEICIAIQTSLWWFWIIPCQSNVLDFTSFVDAYNLKLAYLQGTTTHDLYIKLTTSQTFS